MGFAILGSVPVLTVNEIIVVDPVDGSLRTDWVS